jgi:hypothetical protein
VHALSALAGALLVLVVISDAVGTLVVTQGRSAPWRPTRIWYASTWRATRAIAARLPFEGGETALPCTRPYRCLACSSYGWPD